MYGNKKIYEQASLRHRRIIKLAFILAFWLLLELLLLKAPTVQSPGSSLSDLHIYIYIYFFILLLGTTLAPHISVSAQGLS